MTTRRDFLGTAVSGLAAVPLSALAQQQTGVRTVGILFGGDEDGTYKARLSIFKAALAQHGSREGENLRIEVRWGGGGADALKALAHELASLKPEVILVGPTNALRPMQAETRTIPLVFVLVSDPLGQGIVDSLARPSGNVTGFSNLEFSLIGKWLDIVKEIAPGTRRIGLMIHTSNASSAGWYRAFGEFAPNAGIEPLPRPVRGTAEIDTVIEALAREPGVALVVPGDSLVERPEVRRRIIEMTTKLHVPALFSSPAFVAEGGLVSYGIDQNEPFRLAAGYVDRILKGEKPSDLPVQQPTRFRFAVNLRTAKALGLTVPLPLQVAADEVIE